MRYFIIAGERSGDMHGGNLVRQIKMLDNEAQFAGFGGDDMEQAGVDIQLHYRDMAFMGFLEVVQNLNKIRGYIKQCKQAIDQFKPDAIILIDYGGFNMKIAKYGKKQEIPVHYYISPKVWAWNQKRALKLKRTVDHMYVILPFEKAFFRKFDWEVDYVGNPVLDAIKQYRPVSDQLPGEYIALLPGSRKQELKNMLPLFAELVAQKSDLQFVVATVNNLDADLYQPLEKSKNVTLYSGSSYDLLANAKAAIVTSGTATLETALWNAPQVVVYKTSGVSYAIAKRLIKVNYISLVNLIADKEVVKELIQGEMTLKNVSAELDALLNNLPYRQSMLDEYQKIWNTLDIGSASENTANLIVQRTKKR